MTGLVLEGGGMRGLYTAGVLDVMMKEGFCPDVICGTSAGVTFGINMPSAQPGRVLRYNKSFMGRPDYVSYRSWLTTGNVVNTDFAYRRLPDELDPFDYETFRQSPTRFYATVTNIRTGEAEYMLVDDCKAKMDVVRASASLPFLSRPVDWEGEQYLDGGIVDNIPLDFCRSLGCDRIVVVLTRPIDYRKEDHLTLLSRIFYPRLKNLQQAFALRNERYRQRLEQILQLEAEGSICVLRPSRLIPVARLEKNPERFQELYDLALADTRACWGEVKKYLRCTI